MDNHFFALEELANSAREARGACALDARARVCVWGGVTKRAKPRK